MFCVRAKADRHHIFLVYAPTLTTIREAAECIQPYAHCTPILTCKSLDQQVGCQVFLKCENFQKVGAFKFRGTCNAVFSLSEGEVAKGVVAHSSGNHAQSLAFDVILLSAVWMYIAPTDRSRAFRKLITLLKPGGLLVITRRQGAAEPEREVPDFPGTQLRLCTRY